jgi:hypothetical protein
MAITKFSTSSLKLLVNKTNVLKGGVPVVPATFSVVGSTYLWGTGGQSKSTSLPVGTITGDFILHLGATDGTSEVPTPTGFTSVFRGGGDTGHIISYRFVQAGDTAISMTGMQSDEIHAFYVFRGINTTIPLTTPIVSPIYTQPNNPNPPLITTQVANSIVLAPIFIDDYLATLTAPSGYTLLPVYRSNLDTNSPWFGISAPSNQDNATTVSLAYLQTTSAGNYDPGLWTGDMGDDSVVATLELRLA